VANSLQGFPQNKYISKTYDEIIHPVKVSDKSGEEIAVEIISKLGLKFMEK